jgi:hypothetical protein
LLLRHEDDGGFEHVVVDGDEGDVLQMDLSNNGGNGFLDVLEPVLTFILALVGGQVDVWLVGWGGVGRGGGVRNTLEAVVNRAQQRGPGSRRK